MDGATAAWLLALGVIAGMLWGLRRRLQELRAPA
jgi:hypothetical protein